MKINTKRILLMLIGNILCGFSVGMFQFASFGIDPFNIGVMGLWHLIKLFDYGTFYLIFSLILVTLDFLFLDKKKLGLGTIANMFLVGYVIEVSYWILSKIFPIPSTLIRVIFLIVALVILCFSSSLYYVADMGVSPYDAIPLTISERTGWKFKIVRVTADCLWVVIGLIGSHLPGVATILIAFCLGPLIEAFHPLCRRILDEKGDL
ncbi:YczE/YyaS/YitT family protein [Clostridium beijerinckii]|uniref:Membrane protein YczE n=1 Tax=Clostridium beijerinckii TaxID=1520 RepID=A0AAW3W5A8_CLOBE|nr:hypothetical protein [Clostridium beijerinckii]MBC2456092.1 hypothetical protein [Clostridium beijerinckii]MBC2473639.1 hypothetical protein [Clostridium beijerinckii]NOV62980.1 putative membrane protein YczE [Clostridium beijerinckii]NOV70058.1 putative membrane protein YczE [Clostridium beijerinckii]NOW31035.1 putative membrane protein YczE [Clostridium beijerinckii]